MVNESVKLVSQIHGQFHRLPSMMKAIIASEYNYDNNSLEKVIEQFPMFCDVCRREGFLMLPEIPQYFLNFSSEDLKKQIKIQGESLVPANSIALLKRKRQYLKKLKKDLPLPKDLQNFLSHEIFWMNLDQSEKLQSVRKYAVNQVNQVVVIVTKSMRQMYYKYGDCIILHEFRSLFGRRSSTGTYFPIILIVGQSNNLEPIIFGVCFVNEGLVKNYKKMLYIFFLQMKKRIPLCVITDDSLPMKRAISKVKLQFGLQFDHYVSWFHMLEYLKKEIVDNKEALLELFCEAILERSQKRYDDIVKKIKQKMIRKSLFNEFVQSSSMYCLTKIKPIFTAFLLSTEAIHTFYRILMENIVYQPRLSIFLGSILTLEKKLRQKSQLSIQLQNEKENIQINHLNLRQNIYSLVVSEILKAKQIVIQELSPISYITREKQREYIVEYLLQKGHWVCECKKIYSQGLPCCHLIRIIEKFKGQIGYYINERWINDQN